MALAIYICFVVFVYATVCTTCFLNLFKLQQFDVRGKHSENLEIMHVLAHCQHIALHCQTFVVSTCSVCWHKQPYTLATKFHDLCFRENYREKNGD